MMTAMPKRSVVVGALLLAMFSGLMIKIYHLADSGLAQVADQQSTVTVTVATARGTLYDRNMQPLVNTGTQNSVSVAPYPAAVAALSEALTNGEFEALADRLQSGRPVTLTLDRLLAPTEGISQFSVPVRYSGDLAAPHLLGYLDGDGLHGVTGIELAFDEYLSSKSGSVKVTYKVDGAGKPLQGIAPEIQNTLDEAKAGIVLSIDQQIQYIAEQAAKKYIDRGAVVVLEPKTGQVLAMVSLPDFQQDTLVEALDDERSPLLNRALCNYNCGSVFKIVSAAAALEAGVSLSESHTCTGSINVGGISFHCHNRLGHGVMSMVSGFAQSCNPYFIQLMQGVGGEALYTMATNLSFDRPLLLAENYKTARAVLPSELELQSPAAVANLSFGQGALLATPMHIAQMVAAVVNGGEVIQPSVVKGFVDKAGNLEESAAAPAQWAFSEQTAQTLHNLMVETVENGTGSGGKPRVGGAGCKTGTAETGWKNDDGSEVVQSWYAGFYPAEQPEYVVVVLAEDAEGSGGQSTPVFREICDDLYTLGLSRQAEG